MSYAVLPTLRTPRLTLRPLEMSDADAIVAGVGNYDVSKWLSVVPYPYTHEDAEWFLEKSISDGSKVWAICDESGFCGVIGIDDELGYWLARRAWGKGYAFEAAHGVVSHWFSEPARDTLTSGYFDGNHRSGAVLRSLGFKETGVRRREARALSQEVSSHEMRLTRPDWVRRQAIELFTPRLRIRPLVEADADSMVALSVETVARGTASIPVGWNEIEARDYINAREWAGLPGFMLAVEQQGNFVGIVGFGGAPLSLMYAFVPDVWGQGVGTEAVSAFLPELFERFPVNRISACHFTDVPASGRILVKHGFEKQSECTGEALARLEPAPMITYAVTRETFRIAT